MTPLNFFNNGSNFSKSSAGGVTSSLTNKATPCFVSFDYTKNSSQLYMDMNLDSFSFVDIGVGGIDFMATLFPFLLGI